MQRVHHIQARQITKISKTVRILILHQTISTLASFGLKIGMHYVITSFTILQVVVIILNWMKLYNLPQLLVISVQTANVLEVAAEIHHSEHL